ncbi:MAG: PulJ/GspJ family protein [Elusimicrobiota bacterium]
MKSITTFLTDDKGFTLTELITVMVVSSLIALTIGAYFVNEYEMRMNIINRTNKTQEARVALRALTHKLRFAKPGTVELENGTFKADIKGGHLSHPQHNNEGSNQFISFRLNGTNLQESYDENNWTTIARNVSHFKAEPNPDDPDSLILVGVEVDGKELQIRTGLKMLGDIQE